MHRRLAALLFAVLVALPVVAPAMATEPVAGPSIEVPPSPAAEPTPTPEPTPSAEPTSAPSPSPSASDAPDEPPAVAPTVPTTTTGPAPAAAPPADGRPDATGRFIVMFRNGVDTTAAVKRAQGPRPEGRPELRAGRARVRREARQEAGARPQGRPERAGRRARRRHPAGPDHPDRRLAGRRPGQRCRRHRRLRPARRCRCGDRRHRHRAGPGPQRRRRLQLLVGGPDGVARQERPRHARGRHGRGPRQQLRCRRCRPGCPCVGGQDPQRQRLRPHLVVRLRARLDPRPARPERREPAAVRGRQHERDQGRLPTTATAG